ncbi:MAG: nucleoside triphosphate pyrophosphohydrolase [Candidatus Fermentibacteraceae bacterium]
MDRRLEAIAELLATVRTLRSPGGCAWDRRQTISSLRPFMLEEAYEVADAISGGSMDEVRRELGDLLLHVLMMSTIAEEEGEFDLAGVAEGIRAKLVRRHPHVFDEESGLTPEEVEQQWEAIKSGEKGDEGFFGSLPPSLPALQAAWRLQQRASEVGFDWPEPEGAREKLREELEELEEALDSGDSHQQRRELGDLLFSVVNYCRLMGFEPEASLRDANAKFIRRFTRMERSLSEEGISLHQADLQTMEEHWQRAKEAEGKS